MRTALIAGLLSIGLVSDASAEPVTVWFTDEAPDDRAVSKADLQTGGTLHLWQADLRYPPQPETPADQERFEQIAAAIENGRERWEEFEIEVQIANDLQMVVDDLDLIRTRRDKDELVRALLFQGTAVARSFDPTLFAVDPNSEAFRAEFGTTVVPRPWLDAYALSGRPADRSEVVDGTGWLDYQRFAESLAALEPAQLKIDDAEGEVFLDGEPVTTGTVELRPGKHWVHLVRGGVISGRQVLDLAPGETYEFPAAVSDEDLALGRERVLVGRGSQPDSVRNALGWINDRYGGPIYLGAVDGSKVSMAPYADDAELEDRRLVTGLLTGEIGGGILGTSMFAEEPGNDLFIAPMVHGGLGFELGISYFLFAGGIDAAFTPGRTLRFSQNKTGESNQVSVFPHPWAGIGAYFVRPTKSVVTANLSGGVSWLGPAHLGYGGRLAIGVPIDEKHNWFRIVAGGYYSPSSLWDPSQGQAMISGFVRIGFGSRL